MKIFNRIEPSSFSDHMYLKEGDECYFHGFFESRKGFVGGEINDFILNFKKSVDRKGKAEWRYKEEAIAKASNLFFTGINQLYLKKCILIPCPSSKLKSDDMYDDRLLRSLMGIPGPLDIRELIIQNKERKSMHQFSGETRYNPLQLMSFWEIDETLTQHVSKSFCVFDDVLTNGTHFRAMKDMLLKRFPNCNVVGFFLARVARPKMDFESVF